MPLVHLVFTYRSPKGPRRTLFATGRTRFCPISGRNLLFAAASRSLVDVRDSVLVRHLVATTGLTESEATRVVEDVVAYLAEPVEDFVRRRHTEMKTYGAKNTQIFERISAELADRVVAAPQLTERQLRRIVYG
jgi:hypothetical protein